MFVYLCVCVSVCSILRYSINTAFIQIDDGLLLFLKFLLFLYRHLEIVLLQLQDPDSGISLLTLQHDFWHD